MKRIALTGGIACGKSLVAKYLHEFGVETLDADDVVHEILPDPAERKRIATEVFADPEKRKALEARLHPQVKARLESFLSAPRAEGVLRMVVVPLLFESGWNVEYDTVICIAAERETQIARMISTRGYTRAEAEARLAAQWPVAEKAAKSDFVINNNGTPAELHTQVAQLVKAVDAESLPRQKEKNTSYPTR